MGFGILSLIWIWSVVFDTTMFHILAKYLYFEGSKNTNVLHVLILGFSGGWRFLTRVWHVDLDLNKFTDLGYHNIPNFSSLS